MKKYCGGFREWRNYISVRNVEILQATKTAPSSLRRSWIQVDRIRVAAYCRVSTDGDEQLGSFASQKAYYEEKILQNKDWVMAGIFADEAITGTKVDKREEFQEMIRKCHVLTVTAEKGFLVRIVNNP